MWKEKLHRLDIKRAEAWTKFSDKLTWAIITIGTVIMLGLVIYKNWG